MAPRVKPHSVIVLANIAIHSLFMVKRGEGAVGVSLDEICRKVILIPLVKCIVSTPYFIMHTLYGYSSRLYQIWNSVAPKSARIFYQLEYRAMNAVEV